MSHDPIVISEPVETPKSSWKSPWVIRLETIAQKVGVVVTIEPHKSMFRISSVPSENYITPKSFFGNFHQCANMLFSLAPRDIELIEKLEVFAHGFRTIA